MNTNTTSLIDTLNHYGDFALGGESANEVAAQWERHGFTLAADVDAWLKARCFDPQAASDLWAAGVTPSQATAAVMVGGQSVTIGYAVSNGDLSADAAVDLA